MRRVLIIGGAGFVGANLARRWLREDAVAITVFDSLEPRLRGSYENLREIESKIHFIRGDIRDAEAVRSVVQGHDVIYNCAAQTSHVLSMEDPLFDADINCRGNLVLLEELRRTNSAARTIFTSTSTVVGRVSGKIDEDQLERPRDIYSANKGVAEKYYSIYAAYHGLKTVALRFANLYGPYGKPYPEFSFVNYFIHTAWSGLPIRVFGDGRQTRNVMYVDDATDLLVAVAGSDSVDGEILFAGHDEHPTVREIAERVVTRLGRGSVESVPWPQERAKTEVDAVLISSERLKKSVPWSPSISLDEGLRRMRNVLSGKRIAT